MINHGIIPALKYMVAATNRNQNFLFHSVSLVNMYPRKAAITTVSAVPINVLPIEILKASASPGICPTLV